MNLLCFYFYHSCLDHAISLCVCASLDSPKQSVTNSAGLTKDEMSRPGDKGFFRLARGLDYDLFLPSVHL